MRKFFQSLFSLPSLVLLAGAAGSAAATAWLGDPAYLVGVAGFMTGWATWLGAALGGPGQGRGRQRARQAAAYRQLLDEAVPQPTVQPQSVREHMFRREQLDRIGRLEHHIVAANADTP